MPSRYVEIAAEDGGRFKAYVSDPPGHRVPGIVLIQEIFGINPFMREYAERLSTLGYLVACPDLFWRQEPGFEIMDRTEAEWQKAFEKYQGFDEAKGLADLKATLAYLRDQPQCTGQVGCVGFCLGGKLAYGMATGSDIDAAVGYYGVGIEGALDQASRIAKPLMLHIAENDSFCKLDAQAQIKAGLGDNPLVTLHSYAGMEHAFARIGGEHYDADQARIADDRTLAFFKTHLR